jgi:uncharacterized protein YceH (UPF0502 family)
MTREETEALIYSILKEMDYTMSSDFNNVTDDLEARILRLEERCDELKETVDQIWDSL